MLLILVLKIDKHSVRSILDLLDWFRKSWLRVLQESGVKE